MKLLINTIITLVWFGIYALMVVWCFMDIGFAFNLITFAVVIWWMIVLLIWLKVFQEFIDSQY